MHLLTYIQVYKLLCAQYIYFVKQIQFSGMKTSIKFMYLIQKSYDVHVQTVLALLLQTYSVLTQNNTYNGFRVPTQDEGNILWFCTYTL